MNMSSLERLVSNKKNLERILDNLQEGIIAHDLQRRIFFFNREAERITGYRREELLERDCHQAFGTPFCGGHCSFCEQPTPPRDTKSYFTTITNRQGETRRLDLSVTSMYDEEGQPAGVLASFKDITDLLQLRMQAKRLTSFANIIGQDIKMLQVFQQITDVAQYDYPVHISGDTGTGKELVANAIHNESRRSGGPFVPINCGALPEGLIESELFGHVKGAFSGAVREKKGRFAIADGGTVFLDEIAELSRPMQVKLLRFLQENRFEKVGGEKTISVDIRVISATNKDLAQEVQRNQFREDLFYRLNVIPIKIPPLRQRKNDIPLLVNHFLQEAHQRYGKKPYIVSRDAMAALMDYQWPGNVRELQNAIQFAVVKCNQNLIRRHHLPLEFSNLRPFKSVRGPARKLDPDIVRKSLRKTAGNKSKAARLLGVGRATLYRFIDDFPEVIEEENVL